MYKAKYLNRETGDVYWRTVFADTLNEATRAANRYARKGFTCALVTRISLGGY